MSGAALPPPPERRRSRGGPRGPHRARPAVPPKALQADWGGRVKIPRALPRSGPEARTAGLGAQTPGDGSSRKGGVLVWARKEGLQSSPPLTVHGTACAAAPAPTGVGGYGTESSTWKRRRDKLAVATGRLPTDTPHRGGTDEARNSLRAGQAAQRHGDEAKTTRLPTEQAPPIMTAGLEAILSAGRTAPATTGRAEGDTPGSTPGGGIAV